MLIILLSYVSFYEMPVPVSQLSYIDLIIHHPAAHHLAAKITSIYHVRQLFIQFFPSDSSHTPRQQVRGAPPLYFCVRRQRAREPSITLSRTKKQLRSHHSLSRHFSFCELLFYNLHHWFVRLYVALQERFCFHLD
jgi:hypothetical protein